MSKGDLIEGHTEDYLLRVSEDAVNKKTKNSLILDVEAEKHIPKFEMRGMYAVSTYIRICFRLVLTLSRNILQHSTIRLPSFMNLHFRTHIGQSLGSWRLLCRQ
jgi:hypothetical protein